MYTSYFKRSEPRSKKYKALSILAFGGFILVLIALSYFVYNQVNTLLSSNQLDKFKKYSIQQLFASDENKIKFTDIIKVDSHLLINLNSISFANDMFAVAVGDSGTLLLSRDNGKTWLKKELDRSISLSDVQLFPNGRGLIVGDSASLYFTTNYLDTLQQIPIAKGYAFFRIKFIDDRIGFITGNKGLILKTTNGGINWYKVNTNTNEIIFDIAFFDGKRGFAVGWNGTMINTTDGGELWVHNSETMTDNYLKSIDLTKDGYGLIAGGDGTVLRSTNFGGSWEKSKINDAGGFQRVKFISDSRSMIIGSRGIILISKDKGESWDLVESRIYSNMNGIALNPTGQIFMVGVNGMIFKIQ